jgi:hypothetical protein
MLLSNTQNLRETKFALSTDTGADAKETPIMKARNARNEGLETLVLKST